MRNSQVERNTTETQINMTLNLDGKGLYKVDTGCGFLDHMLELFAKHASFDMEVYCKGDIKVDYHHTAEDVAIVLGDALMKALGNKKGINRYGDIMLPMDETLILCATDLSGRSYLNFDVDFKEDYKIGDFDAELIQEFFLAFVRSANVNLHISKIFGTNAHHIAEGIFKAFARVLKQAVKIDTLNPDMLPSTKGSL